jgi:hypothetical protein
MIELSSEVIFSLVMLCALIGICFSPDKFWFTIYKD